MTGLTVTQLAAALQCSTTKLRRLTRAGAIPHLKIGRLVRYELDRVKDALRVSAPPRSSVRAAGLVTAQPAAPPRTPRWITETRKLLRAERLAQEADRQARRSA